MTIQKNLYQKILAVSGAAIKKDAFIKINNKGAGYKAVKYDTVLTELNPLLEKEGLVFIASKTKSKSEIIETYDFNGKKRNTYFVDMEVEGVVINADNPEERHAILADGHGMDNGDKAPGKAFSYAAKNAMLKMFSVITGENDEERVGSLSNNNSNPSEYIIPIGKFRGKTFSQISKDELVSYCQFMTKDKVPEGPMKIFIDNARLFLHKTKDAPKPAPQQTFTTDDVAF